MGRDEEYSGMLSVVSVALELMSYLPSFDRDSTFLGRLSARESNLNYIIWVNKITDGKHLWISGA
jgi:hypothetical protein